MTASVVDGASFCEVVICTAGIDLEKDIHIALHNVVIVNITVNFILGQ